jgi:N-acetylmuramoyl-L-alanine amidase
MQRRKIKIIWWITPRYTRKILLITLLFVSLLFMQSEKHPLWETWTQWTLPLAGKLILIDAGHGGADSGAVSSNGIMEKMINLNVSIYLRDYLQQSGAIVKLTREVDQDLASTQTKKWGYRKTEDLTKRAEMIKEQAYDMFISIHMNSMRSHIWKGAQTFYTSNHEENERLAVSIQDELTKNLENTNRVAKILDSPVYILNQSKIPSVLIEAGFLSNADEAIQLSSKHYQRKIANSVYQGILAYFTSEGRR